MHQKTLMILLVSFWSFDLFAGQLYEIEIDHIDDVSVIVSPKGCVRTKKGFLGFKRKVIVDCYGVYLRNVSGTNNLDLEVRANDVILFPVAEDRAQADAVARNLIAVIKRNIPESMTIDLSSLRYADKEFALSEITKDPLDQELVKMGGIDMTIKLLSYENMETITDTLNIHAGIR